ncbi:MAG: hypothetical protein C4K60_00285 [Ideonella sp. MAG2]|nr:MAG: hypothetical protein C4K60_00285 [Ideonella sp. MAG2]
MLNSVTLNRLIDPAILASGFQECQFNGAIAAIAKSACVAIIKLEGARKRTQNYGVGLDAPW